MKKARSKIIELQMSLFETAKLGIQQIWDFCEFLVKLGDLLLEFIVLVFMILVFGLFWLIGKSQTSKEKK